MSLMRATSKLIDFLIKDAVRSLLSEFKDASFSDHFLSSSCLLLHLFYVYHFMFIFTSHYVHISCFTVYVSHLMFHFTFYTLSFTLYVSLNVSHFTFHTLRFTLYVSLYVHFMFTFTLHFLSSIFYHFLAISCTREISRKCNSGGIAVYAIIIMQRLGKSWTRQVRRRYGFVFPMRGSIWAASFSQLGMQTWLRYRQGNFDKCNDFAREWLYIPSARSISWIKSTRVTFLASSRTCSRRSGKSRIYSLVSITWFASDVDGQLGVCMKNGMGFGWRFWQKVNV